MKLLFCAVLSFVLFAGVAQAGAYASVGMQDNGDGTFTIDTYAEGTQATLWIVLFIPGLPPWAYEEEVNPNGTDQITADIPQNCYQITASLTVWDARTETRASDSDCLLFN